MRALCSLLVLLTIAAPHAGTAQTIEFESGGLTYLTQTRNSVTVMFAPLPTLVREYAVMQVAISNGSKDQRTITPQDFIFRRPDGTETRARSASDVVKEFGERGGGDDVGKLVTAYEQGLYGISRIRSTNGFQQRRQAALAYVDSAKLKAAAAASAIALVPLKLKSGDSTDGVLFFPNSGKPLGAGKLIVNTAAATFEFEVLSQ
jgi:hypothetical protein